MRAFGTWASSSFGQRNPVIEFFQVDSGFPLKPCTNTMLLTVIAAMQNLDARYTYSTSCLPSGFRHVKPNAGIVLVLLVVFFGMMSRLVQTGGVLLLTEAFQIIDKFRRKKIKRTTGSCRRLNNIHHPHGV
jgi:hypothetical protein